jgi:hypothetical protein
MIAAFGQGACYWRPLADMHGLVMTYHILLVTVTKLTMQFGFENNSQKAWIICAV